jgi:hypothetical protein
MLMAETENKKLPRKIKKVFDLGFYGIDSEYQNVVIPHKKPKGKELNEKQKDQNKKISRVRVRIENAFAGVKRLRIVYNVSRTRRSDFIDLTFLVSCGIWNFYLEYK